MALSKYPSESTFVCLERILSNWKNYYQIRCMAVVSLASISSSLPHMRNEVIAQLMSFFENKWCLPKQTHSDLLIVKPNHFDHFPNYFIQKAIVQILGKIKDDHGKTPPEILRFLIQLLKLNNNTQNTVCLTG